MRFGIMTMQRGALIPSGMPVEEALALAREVQHPHSIGWALSLNTMLRLGTGNIEETIRFGEEAIPYYIEQEQPFWLATVTQLVGWARMKRGEIEEGLAQAKEGFKALNTR